MLLNAPPQDHGCAPAAYWFSEADAWNVKCDYAVAEWKLDDDVVVSMRRWAGELDGEVFINQMQETATDDKGVRSETRPFIFGLCPKRTLAKLRELLHNGALLCDATFCAFLWFCHTVWHGLSARPCPAARGARPDRVWCALPLPTPAPHAALNAQRYHVTTLMVIDEHNHGLPIAHVIHSSATADTMVQVFNALREFVGVDIQPKFILVDDCKAEIAAIQACAWGIKGCNVALCNWHVKRSWLKNLIAKVGGKEKYSLRIEIFGALQELQSITVGAPRK